MIEESLTQHGPYYSHHDDDDGSYHSEHSSPSAGRGSYHSEHSEHSSPNAGRGSYHSEHSHSGEHGHYAPEYVSKQQLIEH